jgi:hypothetical protein
MDMKEMYETLDVLEDTLSRSIMLPDGALAELLMVLTGTVVEVHTSAGRVPTHDPDAAVEARKTVLRWLRDHGYVPGAVT